MRPGCYQFVLMFCFSGNNISVGVLFLMLMASERNPEVCSRPRDVHFALLTMSTVILMQCDDNYSSDDSVYIFFFLFRLLCWIVDRQGTNRSTASVNGGTATMAMY